MTVAEADISALVESTLRELLGDAGLRQQLLGTSTFTPELRDQLETVSAQVGQMLQDRSLGTVMNGPTWLSGASVVNGTVTADKLIVNSLEAVTTSTGNLNVTGNITAATSFPATSARIVMNASGLVGYSGAATTTFKLNIDGSGELGSGTNKVSWDTSGVVTVPVAAVGGLTIAAVGGGIVGGTYATSANTSKIDFSSSGIVAYATGVETWRLNATTGAMTATGSFTVQSAASGARVVMSDAGGIEGYNSSGTRTFFVNAATGAGILGLSGTGISWDTSGTVSIGGVALSSGKITAAGLSVSNLAAISADLGTITAGSISASRITAGTFLDAATGTIALGSASLDVKGTGKITNSDGDEWSSTGIKLVSSGVVGDSISWWTSGTRRFDIATTSTSALLTATSGVDIVLTARGADPTVLLNNTGVHIAVNGFGPSNAIMESTSARTRFGGYIYPGDGTTNPSQSSYYIDAVSNGIGIKGMLDISTGNTFNLVSPGTGGSASSWSAFTSSNIPDKSAGYFLMKIGGTSYRVPFYANS